MSMTMPTGTVEWQGEQVPLAVIERRMGTHPDARPGRITELSPRETQILWMYGGQGLSVKQVAIRLHITEETTKSYLKRLREKLRARALDSDEISIEVGNKRGLYLAALDECRTFQACIEERDRLLRRLLTVGAPELVPTHP